MEQVAHARVRVRPLTRAFAGGLFVILVLTAASLTGWPGETERYFAWTIKPDLTPLLMGAGYASGIVFFGYVARGPRWLEVSFGLVGITVFATLMAGTTLIHWDRFNHDHPTFWAWLALYAVAPVLVPALWLHNGGWRPGPVEAGDVEVPKWVRAVLGLVGGSLFVIGIAIFLRPQLAIDHWPWDVSPLTARVIASFTALNVGWAAASLDRRWSAIRIPCLASLTGWILVALALVRSRDDLHTDRATAWIYVGGVAGLVVLLGGLLVAMSRRRRVG